MVKKSKSKDREIRISRNLEKKCKNRRIAVDNLKKPKVETQKFEK